jgi:glycosyltransferase involved in cell wall biosynthesis
MILLQTAIADYRNSFINNVSKIFGDSFKINVGPRYFEESTTTSKYVLEQDYTKEIKNIFLLNNKVCFQLLPLYAVITEDVVVFELNPRIISNWPVMIIRKLIGKKNVLWGHAWSRNGANSKTEFLRHLMRRLNHSLLFYTEQQKLEFNQKYPEYKGGTYVAPNSLYSEADIEAVPLSGDDILYVGRLVKSKRVDLLISALSLAINKISHPVKLHIVGNGPEANELHKLTKELGLEDNVIFYGHVSDINELKVLYQSSLLTVSPGYVGLSITQSFAFGRPMLVADKENHSPEIEAFVEKKNGLFFSAGSAEDLAAKLIVFFETKHDWVDKYDEIAQDCKVRYSTEKMANGFADAVRK